ncbi:mesothelin-like protein [Heptranchias perlo]|uniref:mesothelin-like protein n=1 Tax=Heptranchias perlo TaxID=212740 RepID=UPI0035595BDA
MMQKTVLPNWTFSLKIMMVNIAMGFFVATSNTQPAFAEKVLETSLNEQSEKSPQMLVKARVKRATACTQGFITPEKTTYFLLPTVYSAATLDTCLNNSVLAANLTELGNLAFSTDQLLVIKRKLAEKTAVLDLTSPHFHQRKILAWGTRNPNESVAICDRNSIEDGRRSIYPGGLPQEEIQKLGIIITVYTTENISQWIITDPDALAAAIQNSGSAEMINALQSNYLKGSGVLDVTALNAIGGTMLCTASEEKLKTILPTELKKAKPLDISTCSQAKKDILFGIANVAFQDKAGNPKAYYNLLKPYVGGALVADLQSLAAGKIMMDYETFKGLNPTEVEKLTPQNIRDLLGVNLNSLKENENQEIVQHWINTHTASEVKSLGIGLQGAIFPAGLGNFHFWEIPGSASVNNYSLLLSICIAVMSITMQWLL